MRRVSCDQYEFDPPDSEQTLDLAIASSSCHYPHLASLLAKCGASSPNGSSLPVDWPRWPEVVTQLSRFAGLELPPLSQLREAVLLQDDCGEVEIAVAFGTTFVWYHWSTSA